MVRPHPSYLIWHDNVARVLIDLGSGSQIGFEESGASFETVEAIALTQLSLSIVAICPCLSAPPRRHRTQRLGVLSPTGDGQGHLSTREFMQRLFGADGVYPYLADAIKPEPVWAIGYAAWMYQATGSKRWAGYQTEHVKLSAIPVHSVEASCPCGRWKSRTKSSSSPGTSTTRKILSPPSPRTPTP